MLQVEITYVALTHDNSIKCWGEGQSGRLGNGTNTNMTYPTAIAGNKKYKKVLLGDNSSCALQTNGLLDCWGANGKGQLGLGDTNTRKTPTTNPYVSDIIDFAFGKTNGCAVKSNGTVWCWGENENAELGLGRTSTFETIPQQIQYDISFNAFDNVTQIALGGRDDSGNFLDGGCALKSNGTVWCWGDNVYGQIGNGTTSPVSTLRPTQVSGITTAVHISRVGGTACATLENGTIQCWGLGINGQIGDGSTSSRNSPTTVSGITTAVRTAIGPTGLHNCALLQDGSVKCWGINVFGELGIGTTVSPQNTPVDLINPLSCAADKYVFVTSQAYSSNLGGLEGADAICQAHADRANLPGRYMAWISDNTGSPSTRFNRVPTDYKLVDGTIVANGWDDLTDGTLDAAINLHEDGTVPGVGLQRPWSVTNTDGTYTNGPSCNNWTLDDGPVINNVMRGSVSQTNSTWTATSSNSCAASSHTNSLFCFQQ